MKTSIAMKTIPLFVIVAAIAILSGCSPAITISVADQAHESAVFDAEISATAENIIRRFTGNQQQIFDKAEITKSVTAAGLKIESLAFPKQTSIAIALTVPNFDGMLGKAITVSQSAKSITFTLSRDSIKSALTLMPESTNEYLDLLMAPVFTDEDMSAEEYESVIAAAYGKTLADELKKSSFLITVRCPSTVHASRLTGSGTASKTGNAALFTIPLSSVLAMEKPITGSATW
jgi:hypothetical protein